jgi:hypothetical protein
VLAWASWFLVQGDASQSFIGKYRVNICPAMHVMTGALSINLPSPTTLAALRKGNAGGIAVESIVDDLMVSGFQKTPCPELC